MKEQEREEKAQQAVQAVQALKNEMKEKERIAQKEHKKVKELQDLVEDLQLTLEKKEEEHESAKRREERARKRIEDVNDELRRKAALGWMLGCLSELYLRLDPEVGTGGIIKLVRKVQRELESGNHVFSTGSMMPPKLEYELIRREIRRLINASDPARPDLTEKLRTSAAMLRTTKPKEFSGELPGDRRKKLRLHKYLREQEASLRSTSAPSQLPLRRESTACQGFILRDYPKQKHHVACHQDVQKRGPGTWAEVRLVEADQAAAKAKQTSYHEIKRILQGLESSMTYLLGQERRRRLYNQRRL